mgnify:CR=1 FL=1
MRVLKHHKVFLIIFLLFFVVKIFSLFVSHDIWWDSSVYLGMGKYIYSSGEAGLWEPSRPLVWPLMLGFFWEMGIDYVLSGRLLVIIFSSGILLLTYLIANELFDKKIAIIASLFLFLSQTFFLFGNILHTEIPSALFVLLGFYFFVKKKYNFSGLFLGIAFMTRFFQIFAFIPLILLLFYLFVKKKEPYKALFYFSLYFLIPVVPYLISNYILYDNPFYPFLLQSWMSEYTGWVFSQPFYFYFVNLVKENVLVLFSILGFIFVFKKFDLNKISLVLLFLFVFVPYNLVAHKEMRLLITALPFLYILTAYGLLGFVNNFKKNKTLLLSLLLIIFFILTIPKLKFDRYDDNLDLFYDYIDNEKIMGGLWISNPAFIAYSDAKADELIYYPLYNSEKIDFLIDNIDNAEHVLLNTCDLLPCPSPDIACNQKHNTFFNLLKGRFVLVSNTKYAQCEYYIFTSDN